MRVVFIGMCCALCAVVGAVLGVAPANPEVIGTAALYGALGGLFADIAR